jgi:hypothetical protein
MVRLKVALLTILVAHCAVTVARADNWFYYGTWHRHVCQNVRWPEQHFDHDRIAARAPLQAMIANGWRTQNTISNYHFNEITGELNDAGKLKLRAVLYESPAEWRTIYVLRADAPDISAARMQSVQKIAGELMQGDPVPAILPTTVEPRGTRGDISNRVNGAFMENAPAPVLPQRTATDGGM